jgi:hypothetical protein
MVRLIYEKTFHNIVAKFLMFFNSFFFVAGVYHGSHGGQIVIKHSITLTKLLTD